MPADPEPLTDEQLEELGGLLEAARAETEAALDAGEDETRTVSVDEPIGRLTRMDALQQQSMAKANRRSLEDRLQQVSAALVRLREGVYGECASCEEPIGHLRLKARPETRLCVRCQERLERRR